MFLINYELGAVKRRKKETLKLKTITNNHSKIQNLNQFNGQFRYLRSTIFRKDLEKFFLKRKTCLQK